MAAVWEWLKLCGAPQKWAKTVKISTKGIESAEDLYVEAVCRISEKLPRDSTAAQEIRRLVDKGDIDGATACFDEYAYRRFRDVVRTHNRKAQKEPVRFSELLESSVEPCEVGRLLPTSELEFEELRVLLVGAIAQLPEKERDVVIGKFFEGRSNGELATLLNCTEATVRSLQSRALKALARLVARN